MSSKVMDCQHTHLSMDHSTPQKMPPRFTYSQAHNVHHDSVQGCYSRLTNFDPQEDTGCPDHQILGKITCYVPQLDTMAMPTMANPHYLTYTNSQQYF